jgi:putative MATE family efflux protein
MELNTLALEKEKISKLLWQYLPPAIVGMVVGGLHNIISRVFVGREVGIDALSGVAVAYPVMIILFAFSMLITLGAAALISIRLGEKKQDEAERIVGNAFAALLIVSAILIVILLFYLEPILRFMGADDLMLPYAKTYMLYLMPGIPFMGLGYGMNNFIRAEGRPLKSMLTQLLGAAINISLTFLFVSVLQMGVKGAALAMVVSQVCTAFVVMYHFVIPSPKSLLRLRAKNIRLDPKLMLGIFGIGMAPFAAQSAGAFVLIIFNWRLGIYGGGDAIAAYAAISGVGMLFVMPIMGTSQGLQPIIGYNFGARLFARLRRTVFSGVIIGFSMGLVSFVVVQLFPVPIINLFGGEAEFRDMTVMGLRLFFAVVPLVGIQIIAGQYFQAIGRGKLALLLTVTRQCIFLIPSLLILSHFFGLTGIWFAPPLSDLLSFVVTMSFFTYNMRRMKKMQENEVLQEETTQASVPAAGQR